MNALIISNMIHLFKQTDSESSLDSHSQPIPQKLWVPLLSSRNFQKSNSDHQLQNIMAFSFL